MDKTLENYLRSHNISYTLHSHPPVFTVEESKNLKKEVPGLHTKSLFLKDEGGKYYLVCLPAEKRLNSKVIRKEFSIKKLNFASPEELNEILQVTPGSVSLFAMIYSKSVNLILDKDVWSAELVGFHPNINTSTLEINHENLEKFCKSLNISFKILTL